MRYALCSSTLAVHLEEMCPFLPHLQQVRLRRCEAVLPWPCARGRCGRCPGPRVLGGIAACAGKGSLAGLFCNGCRDFERHSDSLCPLVRNVKCVDAQHASSGSCACQCRIVTVSVKWRWCWVVFVNTISREIVERWRGERCVCGVVM